MVQNNFVIWCISMCYGYSTYYISSGQEGSVCVCVCVCPHKFHAVYFQISNYYDNCFFPKLLIFFLILFVCLLVWTVASRSVISLPPRRSSKIPPNRTFNDFDNILNIETDYRLVLSLLAFHICADNNLILVLFCANYLILY
jgi:hypothetical protein